MPNYCACEIWKKLSISVVGVKKLRRVSSGEPTPGKRSLGVSSGDLSFCQAVLVTAKNIKRLAERSDNGFRTERPRGSSMSGSSTKWPSASAVTTKLWCSMRIILEQSSILKLNREDRVFNGALAPHSAE